MQAPRPSTEEARLAALYQYEILDKPVEQEFDDITSLLSRFCNAPIAVINLIDRERQWFLSEIGLGVKETPLDISICAHAILQRGLFIVNDTLLDPRFADNPLVTGDPRLRYYAGALLETCDGHALGTLCVLDYQPRELTEDQKELMTVLARQVMKQLELRRLVRLQNVVLEERDSAREALTAAHAREKRIAETLQRSLLMDESECQFARIDIVPRYEAAWEESIVGGDFYDVFAIDMDHVALVVGDVAGKGLEAAARTAEVKYALRAFLHEHPNPAHSLQRLNTFLCSFHDFNVETVPRFVVASVCVINVQTGEAYFASAGAEPALVMRRADWNCVSVKFGGMPLGVESNATYESQLHHLGSDEIVILATDGITEARRENKFIGTEGFIDIIRDEERPNLGDWADAILQAVKSYVGGNLHDDICVVMARLRNR